MTEVVASIGWLNLVAAKSNPLSERASCPMFKGRDGPASQRMHVAFSLEALITPLAASAPIANRETSRDAPALRYPNADGDLLPTTSQVIRGRTVVRGVSLDVRP